MYTRWAGHVPTSTCQSWRALDPATAATSHTSLTTPTTTRLSSATARHARRSTRTSTSLPSCHADPSSLNLKTEVPKVRLTKGSTKIYDDNGTDSGKTIHRNFCGDCGSQLWSDPEAIPGVRFLKVSWKRQVLMPGWYPRRQAEPQARRRDLLRERYASQHYSQGQVWAEALRGHDGQGDLKAMNKR